MPDTMKSATKESTPLNPAAPSFIPGQPFISKFDNDLHNLPRFRRSEIHMSMYVANDAEVEKDTTKKDHGVAETSSPPDVTVHKHLEDIWAMPKKLTSNLEKIRLACGDVLAWETELERVAPSQPNQEDLKEAFKNIKKALKEQEVLVEEIKRELGRANEHLARSEPEGKKEVYDDLEAFEKLFLD